MLVESHPLFPGLTGSSIHSLNEELEELAEDRHPLDSTEEKQKKLLSLISAITWMDNLPKIPVRDPTEDSDVNEDKKV